MKKVMCVCFVTWLMASTAEAVKWIVEDPCGGEPWLELSDVEQLPASLGQLTVQRFDAVELVFEGNEKGIHSIRSTVTGDDALEIISSNEMRAYGWCYRVNGIISEKLASEYQLGNQDSQVNWFFAFAHYLDGQWISQCQPTAASKPRFICAHE